MDKFPNGIEPGSFFEPDDAFQPAGEKPDQQRAFGPESSEGLKGQLEVFKEVLKPDDAVIYYPCCQNETTISEVFPNSRIIYADINEGAIAMLKQHGYEALVADANTYRPEEAPDIVMLQNPSIGAEGPAAALKSGGYLLCNNYHDTANELHNNKEFELVGVTAQVAEGRTELKNQDLEDYFTPINTDDELKKLRPGWGSTLSYEHALSLIQELGDTGAYEKVLSGESTAIGEYEKLIKKYAHMAIPGMDQIGWQDKTGRVFLLQGKLPAKKGGADDLYVYKKKLPVQN